jgi:hypothetical protein
MVPMPPSTRSLGDRRIFLCLPVVQFSSIEFQDQIADEGEVVWQDADDEDAPDLEGSQTGKMVSYRTQESEDSA